MTLQLSPAARCYEFEVPNRDGPDWRWLVLDTVTVGAKHAGERDARRSLLAIGDAPRPSRGVFNSNFLTGYAHH